MSMTIGNLIQEWHVPIINVVRLLLSCLCGFLIGYERQERIRQRHMRGAGLRTHMLIAVASAALMMISKYGFMDVLSYGDNVRVDVSRVAAGILSGIGFIGAGIIFMRKDNIMGLTTAAGLIATAAVGMAVGCGMYVCGIALTLLVILIQEMDRLSLYQQVTNQVAIIEWDNKQGMAEKLLQWFETNGIGVSNIRINRIKENRIRMRVDLEINRNQSGMIIAKLQESFPEITRIET